MNNNGQENRIDYKALSQDELAAFVDEHPYHAPAQFWLLAGMDEEHFNFQKQLSKTTLFFNNPRWHQWQLFLQHKKEEPVALQTMNDIEPNEAATETEHEENPQEEIAIHIKEENEPEEEYQEEKKQEETLAFEPLFTVDYFASQGIKINEVSGSNDKLGTQVKSFTEWLKSMKKIHPQKMEQGNEQADKVIQHIAEGSNNSIHVVTEAMAEVLLKQGKTQQAIEVYEKLSLNNPDGSAYFAAKINSLKNV